MAFAYRRAADAALLSSRRSLLRLVGLNRGCCVGAHGAPVRWTLSFGPRGGVFSRGVLAEGGGGECLGYSLNFFARAREVSAHVLATYTLCHRSH